MDYKNCLLEAEGDCFISGTSMIHLSEDSNDILKDKLYTGEVYLLILDPDWIESNSSILTFIKDEKINKNSTMRSVIQFEILISFANPYHKNS
jgi:hypothetical protein